MKIKDLSKERIESYISQGKSIKQVLDELGYNSNGSGAYKLFKNHCFSLGIDYIATSKGSWVFRDKIDSTLIFIEKSTFSPASLRKRVIKENLIPYKCAICNCKSKWKGKELVLQLDHINGISNDNRLENLRFLCPNCHSQTGTYSNKKRK